MLTLGNFLRRPTDHKQRVNKELKLYSTNKKKKLDIEIDRPT